MRNTKYVYLAGPIAAVSTMSATTWRREAIRHLYKYGLATFSPAHAWTLPIRNTGGLDEELVEMKVQPIDDMAVSLCDGVLVSVEPVPSKGTDHELELALDYKKPIVLFVNDHAEWGAWAAEREVTEYPASVHLPTACFLMAMVLGVLPVDMRMGGFEGVANPAGQKLLEQYAGSIT